MGEDKNELSDDEYTDLLRELEGRADDGGGKPKKAGGNKAADDGGGGEDVEDIDAFLRSLESEEDSKSSRVKTKTADEDDDLMKEFASLEEKGELTAPPKKGKKGKKKMKAKAAKKEAGKEEGAEKEEADGEERSRTKRAAIFALQSVFWFLPAAVLWWVLGTYLGQWVSAGWLIAVISSAFVFGLPAILRKLVNRGKYRPWAFGASLVLVVALVAPMPNVAGENMANYGHWPSSVIAEISGAPADAGFVSAHASSAAWLGGLVATTEEPGWEARQLGTIFPLGMQWPPPEEIIPLLEEGGLEAAPEEGGVPEEPLQTGEELPGEATPGGSEAGDPADEVESAIEEAEAEGAGQ